MLHKSLLMRLLLLLLLLLPLLTWHGYNGEPSAGSRSASKKILEQKIESRFHFLSFVNATATGQGDFLSDF